MVPHCELVARWTKLEEDMQTLEYLVDIHGTTDEKYFTIIIDPESPDSPMSPVKKSDRTDGMRIRSCQCIFSVWLYKAVASRYQVVRPHYAGV